MTVFLKPVLYISRCITFEAVRYNGELISSDFVGALKPYITSITHCPEVEIGLPIPRKTLRIVADDKEMKKLRLVQPSTGADLTEKMNAWVKKTLDDMEEVDGFILKAKSPSSGAYDVKIYPAKGEKPAALTARGSGFFGGEVVRRFPDKAVEDDGRLNDERIADNFLKRVYISASFRQVRKSAKVKELIKFQEQNKLLFMSYNQKYMRLMGGISANRDNMKFEAMCSEYGRYMSLCLKDTYKVSNVINTIQHAFGYFSDKLSAKERKYFLDTLEKYRKGKARINVVLSLMRSYILRFEDKYLSGQTFFEPYPEGIIEVLG